jgi:hypothetical protein
VRVASGAAGEGLGMAVRIIAGTSCLYLPVGR